MEWTVYLLIDPRDGEIRYVGCTKQLYTRIAAHWSSRNTTYPITPKTLWLKELDKAGLRPIVETLLATKNFDEAFSTEEAWMRRLSLAGCKLTSTANRDLLIIKGIIRPDERRESGKRMLRLKRIKGYKRITG